MSPPAARMSARARVRLVVGVAALAAAGIAVAGGVLLDGEEEARPAPPLELSLVLRDDTQARALRAAERAYEEGRREDARRRFEAILTSDQSSLEAAVGVAIAAWPNGTVDRLEELAAEHPNSALVLLHLGLALHAEGNETEAETQWRRAEEREPDSPAAIRAEDLLHPDMAPGRPFFFPSAPPPADLDDLPPDEQLAELRARSETGDADDLLHYGVALQRVGRPVSALTVFDRALARQPDNLAVQVAAAVARFDKDDPAAAFSRLGPLTREHPRAAVVRFHLGVLLLWIRQVETARAQLEQAAEADGFYAREARELLARLEEIRT